MGNRRDFLQLGVAGLTAAVTGSAVARAESAPVHNPRRFHFAGREGEKVLNVRVGGNAVGIAEGEYSL
jgi:hypothetical protein